PFLPFPAVRYNAKGRDCAHGAPPEAGRAKNSAPDDDGASGLSEVEGASEAAPALRSPCRPDADAVPAGAVTKRGASRQSVTRGRPAEALGASGSPPRRGTSAAM